MIKYPHCDPDVLHAPKAGCEICNEYAVDLQKDRIRQNINFTGEFDTDKRPCPAWAKREAACQSWPGNIPYKTKYCTCGEPLYQMMAGNLCLGCAVTNRKLAGYLRTIGV